MPQSMPISELNKAEEMILRRLVTVWFTSSKDGYHGKKSRPITKMRNITKLWRRRC